MRALDPLELGSQVLVSSPTWVLDAELHALKEQQPSYAPSKP